MQKKITKLSFNTEVDTLKKLEKVIENSNDFGINKTIIINRALKEYLKKRG